MGQLLEKYTADDWLHPFGNANSWYRAYHGAGVTAFQPIYTGGFTPSVAGTLGPGIYVSPHVEYAEIFASQKPIKVTTTAGPKKYICVFQLAVRPGSIDQTGSPIQTLYPAKAHANYGSEDSEWLILDSADVRPYGILCKEVP